MVGNKDKYTGKDRKPKPLVQCDRCKKKTLKLVRVDKTFITGDGVFYECPCGWTESSII